MKILIVHQYFKTPEEGGGIRTWHIARGLARKGYKVEVLSAHNSRNKKYVYDGFEVSYFKIPYANEFGFFRRIRAFLFFVYKCLLYLKKNRHYDLLYVLTTPLTTGLVAIYGKQQLGIPYVFEVGDMWPEVPVKLGIIRNRMLAGLLYRFERKVYRNAKKLVALSPAISDYIEKIVPDKPIEIITNFSDEEWFISAGERTHGVSVEKPLTISYYGAMGQANNVEFILDVAAECKSKNLPVQFHLMGFGAFKTKLEKESSSHSNVIWHEAGGMQTVKTLLLKSDATYISYLDHPVLNTGSPNKYFDGLIASQLIITNFDGWIGEEIRAERCGFSYNPRTPDKFIQQIEPFISDIELLQEFQKRSRRLGLNKYSKSVQLDTLLKFLKE